MTEPIPMPFSTAAEVSWAALPQENRSLLSVEVQITERLSNGERRTHSLAWGEEGRRA